LFDPSAGLVPDWQTIKDFIVSLGWVKGMFALFFWVSQAWIYMLYRGRLADRQKEIDRIAKENREYRDRFLAALDEKHDYTKALASSTKQRAPARQKPKK
jgi:hypothetical protein